MLNQVQTNLRANSENVGPLTDNVVLRVFSGFFVPKRRAVSNVRSLAEASRDDKVSGFWGRLYGMVRGDITG